MATVTRTYLVDDLDGSLEGVENVQLALDGTSYEIDLSAANAARLREKLERFVNAASPVKTAKTAPAKRSPKGAKEKAAAPARTNRDQVQAIRDWAKSVGLEVSSRGRISKVVQEAFDAAH